MLYCSSQDTEVTTVQCADTLTTLEARRNDSVGLYLGADGLDAPSDFFGKNIYARSVRGRGMITEVLA